LCPDSKATNLILNQVLSKQTTGVRFTYHLFPLPYHIQAYYAAIGVRFFVNKFDASAAALYINHVFDIQDNISGIFIISIISALLLTTRLKPIVISQFAIVRLFLEIPTIQIHCG